MAERDEFKAYRGQDGDLIDGLGHKAAELIGGGAIAAMAGAKALEEAMHDPRPAITVGTRLTKEISLLLAYEARDVAIGSFQKLRQAVAGSEEPDIAAVDGIEVQPDQLEVLNALHAEERPMAKNILAGRLAYSIVRQMQGFTRPRRRHEEPEIRFVRVASHAGGINEGKAKHLAALPDAKLSLHPRRQ